MSITTFSITTGSITTDTITTSSIASEIDFLSQMSSIYYTAQGAKNEGFLNFDPINFLPYEGTNPNGIDVEQNTAANQPLMRIVNAYTATGNIDSVASNEVALTGRGALREISSENEMPYSSDIDQWDMNSGGVASAPVATKDFGEVGVTRLQLDINGGTTSGDFSRVTDATAASIDSVDYTVSFTAKLNSGTSAICNLVISSSSSAENNITVTDEWQDFEVTWNRLGSGTTNGFQLRGSLATSDTIDLLVRMNDTDENSGFQREQASIASSFTYTDGLPVTRAKDELRATTTGTFNTDAQYIFDMASATFIPTNGVIAQCGDSGISYDGANIVADINGTQSSLAVADPLAVSQVRFKYDGANLSVVVDGVESTPVASAAPVFTSTWALGSDASFNNGCNIEFERFRSLGATVFDIDLASGQLVDGDVTVSNVNASIKNFESYSLSSTDCFIMQMDSQILQGVSDPAGSFYGAIIVIETAFDSSLDGSGDSIIANEAPPTFSIAEDNGAGKILVTQTSLASLGDYFDGVSRAYVIATAGNATDEFSQIWANCVKDSENATASGGVYPATISAVSAINAQNVTRCSVVYLTDPVGAQSDIDDIVDILLDQVVCTVPAGDLRYGLSSESDPSLVAFGSLVQVLSHDDPQTVTTGLTTAGQYYHIFLERTEDIQTITDTVLAVPVYQDGGVGNIFTKTSDSRTEGGITYDAYTVGPLTAGVNEQYILDF